MLALILSVILSLEADFVQTKTSALMLEPQVSTGHMSYRSPDYLRWAYDKPQVLVWEMNGQETNVNPQVQKLLRMIMASVSGEAQDDAKMQRESKRLFRSVNIVMDERNGVAQRVEMIEKNGDITLIEFSNVQVR
ncbi:MAG: outer membrane lipoprotein carrier protein LolA [Paludibacteraceae bacterium]|nr:outer membrane lipoprotein carrier protein LolA [Paludibacteraceae bacterium]MBQ6791737.1 outer membrane lipoprotein carrier protein LolA [Paludibacteraceae bacterium]